MAAINGIPLTLTATQAQGGTPATPGGGEPIIRLAARAGGFTLMVFQAEAGAAVENWSYLAQACEAGGDAVLDWMPSDGVARIQVSGGWVSLTTARCGDGNGGLMCIHLPGAACAEAFRRAAAITQYGTLVSG